MDRRIHKRHPSDFQIRVTAVENAEFSASGQVVDISEGGIGAYLPLQFPPGTAVRLNVSDSVLFGFVTRSTSERSYFRTGIEVAQVLIGESDLSRLLKTTLEEVIPEVEWLKALP